MVVAAAAAAARERTRGDYRGGRRVGERDEKGERWTTTTTTTAAAAAGRATGIGQTERKRATTPYRGSVGFDTFTENYIVTTTDPTADSPKLAPSIRPSVYSPLDTRRPISTFLT